MKLGSLFDGSGTCPLAARMCGIEPVWASEIEPYPIRVTKKNFPNMKHLGSILDINGAEIEPVDIITFGSPCQDLSVAGKQAGLINGERSNLFFEAIRIIREMRNATANEFPRFAMWENVPGAFSSNKGQDFRAVLQAFCDLCGEFTVPQPKKWENSGCIMGDSRFSIAWRVLDAQYWGVPQRRKRIFLVADFRGESAGEVLFKREGLSRDFKPCGAAWERIAGDSERGAGAAGFCTEHSADSRGIGYGEEESPTLRAGVVPGVVIEYNPTDSRIKVKEDGICQTLTARMGTGGNTVCNQGGMAVVESYSIQGSMIGRKDENGPQGDGVNKEVSFTLNTIDRHAVCAMNVGFFNAVEEKTPALLAWDYKNPPIIVMENENVEELERRKQNADIDVP